MARIRNRTVGKAFNGALIYETSMGHGEIESYLKDLEESTSIMSAEVDARMSLTGLSTDPLASMQWHLSGRYSSNFDQSWRYGRGDSAVVAVVDTGIIDHPDLHGQVLPGYDFISETWSAMDGDSRDSDASDEGDWNSIGECYPGAPPSNSSWHGTHVSGLIAANSYNGIGGHGAAPGANIIPVRTAGKCGGLVSDVSDGIVWASGGVVPRTEPNFHPADVINLSLEFYGACPSLLQSSINEAVDNGSIIVASSGNQGYDSRGFSPGNCDNVWTVGATTKEGEIASYSNLGPNVDFLAPGGNQQDGLISTSNDGSTTLSDFSYRALSGTSQAAPLVSAGLAILLSIDSSLQRQELYSLLSRTSRQVSTTDGDYESGRFIDVAAAARLVSEGSNSTGSATGFLGSSSSSLS